jgi:transcription antitermination factor NusG
METSEWHAIHVQPRFERVVAFNLNKRIIEHYLPLRRVAPQSSRRSIELPLLPGYVFCYVQARQSRSLWMIPGVLNVLGPPVERAIPSEQVCDLKSIVDNGFAVQQWPFMPTGSMVKVQNGPLKGISGILYNEPSNGRVLVLSIDLIHVLLACDSKTIIRFHLRRDLSKTFRLLSFAPNYHFEPNST